uniref:Sulfotransferase n=1 Tax=Ananas comosus var. bracteatus TaxID=296719 RepID=A0A6V7Q381_ANACO|nr:unnamed protein product [Ananas comosus var. bracteatus]
MGTVLDSHFLALTAIVTVGYQLFFFIITAFLRFDKVTDFAGSTNFIILAVLTLIVKGSWHFRQVVLSILVIIWGLRLGVFLLMRILQWGEDRRFDEMRKNLGKLAAFWLFQAVWVWTVSLPLTIVNASDRNPSVKPQDIIGWIMWFVGISIEAAADQQKLNFKNSLPTKENGVMWDFGNILVIPTTSARFSFGGEYLLAPLRSLMESADKRYSSLEEYRIYKNTTSPLVPLPPVITINFLVIDLPPWLLPLHQLKFPRKAPRACAAANAPSTHQNPTFQGATDGCHPSRLTESFGSRSSLCPASWTSGVISAGPRRTDVLLATYPKSGTTWLKSLLFAVAHRSQHPPADGDRQHPLLTRSPHELVRFLEIPYGDGSLADLESFPAPRILATHIPCSLLHPRSLNLAAV